MSASSAVPGAQNGRAVDPVDGPYVYRRGDSCGAIVPVLRVTRTRDLDGQKSFRQSVPTAKGGWKSGGGTWPNSRPLYRLPELLAADPADLVFFVEGEKDAITLASLGAVATTSAMGAGKAHLSDLSPLKGRHVVILPDHDRPGFDHAEQVARLALEAGAASVRIVRLPGYPVGADLPEAHGRDVTDWLGGR
jgi:hypothetical protein